MSQSFATPDLSPPDLPLQVPRGRPILLAHLTGRAALAAHRREGVA